MNFSKQRGVSLVELMVSITIGLILMAGVLSIFMSSKVTYFANEKTARLQENGRVALDLISTTYAPPDTWAARARCHSRRR
jgi:type IV pilus assembly protein PilW